MYINRRTFLVKNGCMESLVEMAKAEMARTGMQATLMTSDLGPSDLLVLDMPFEDMAKYEAFWTAWSQEPEVAKFFEAWNTLVNPGGGNELWLVR